jgi:hypothetical protein
VVAKPPTKCHKIYQNIYQTKTKSKQHRMQKQKEKSKLEPVTTA